jgi:hypothetical protein
MLKVLLYISHMSLPTSFILAKSKPFYQLKNLKHSPYYAHLPISNNEVGMPRLYVSQQKSRGQGFEYLPRIISISGTDSRDRAAPMAM